MVKGFNLEKNVKTKGFGIFKMKHFLYKMSRGNTLTFQKMSRITFLQFLAKIPAKFILIL